MPFKKGQGGRPKGATNQATREMKEFWREFFDSASYRQSAQQRVLKGTAPHLENYWNAKINGKPVEHHEHSGTVNMPMKVIFELHRD